MPLQASRLIPALTSVERTPKAFAGVFGTWMDKYSTLRTVSGMRIPQSVKRRRSSSAPGSRALEVDRSSYVEALMMSSGNSDAL